MGEEGEESAEEMKTSRPNYLKRLNTSETRIHESAQTQEDGAADDGQTDRRENNDNVGESHAT
jgi:hypothetical protein